MGKTHRDNAKHRHHFVPRKYLRQWCIGEKDAIAVSIKGKSPFLISIDKVAYENEFYSYEQLTLDDIKSLLSFHPRMVTDDLMRTFFHNTIILPVMYRLVMRRLCL